MCVFKVVAAILLSSLLMLQAQDIPSRVDFSSHREGRFIQYPNLLCQYGLRFH